MKKKVRHTMPGKSIGKKSDAPRVHKKRGRRTTKFKRICSQLKKLLLVVFE